jgi:NTE family protein
MAKKATSDTTNKRLAVALQGGGSHGAYTWGVLERLLDQEGLDLCGYCGTSAGAMNATVLAYGLYLGGKPKAKELLQQFWKTVSEVGQTFPLKPNWFDLQFGKGNMDNSLGFMLTEMTALYLSPYQSNPLNYNPLQKILTDIVDFEALKSCDITKLFVCATNVRRGRVKVFKLEEMSIDAVLASACLPYLFQAVTIDGEDYWDGGYMGNPPIFPLIDGTDTQDILVIQINPINIPKTPQTANEIRDRVNELSFNSSLMLEMRKLDFIDRLLTRGVEVGDKFRKIYVHNINPEKDLWDLNLSSKLNTNWQFLEGLHQLGYQYADAWLKENFEHIGVKSTCDIRETFM